MKISILNKFQKSDLKISPFPHIVLKDALNKDIASTLTKEFPLHEFDLSGNNLRRDIPSYKVANALKISNLWRDFIKYHSSRQFYIEVLNAFKEALSEKDFKKYNDYQTGLRGFNSHKRNKVLMDAQISINTPVEKLSSVRKAHLDNTNKFFSGLFYLRLPNDDSRGGNLQLCKWREEYTLSKKIKLYRESLHQNHYEVFDELKYENNLAVLFLNSIESLHSVTPRYETSYPRCFVNLVGEEKDDIFYKQRFLSRKTTEVKNLLRKFINRPD
tara:strand:+ start:1492 stop:2307 length:816 start_codon:yes stop_codon:yes gene_type:complete